SPRRSAVSPSRPGAPGGRAPESAGRLAATRGSARFQNGRLAKCAERGAHLLGEQLRLFPGGEVAALLDLVEVDEVGVGVLRPASRSLVLLAREDADGDWMGDALHVEEAALVLPVQTRGRNSRVGQPVKGDVVEELVTSQLADVARGPVESR